MTSLIRSIARTLKLGRARYLVGSDLDQNTYYEYPSLDGDPGAYCSSTRTSRAADTDARHLL